MACAFDMFTVIATIDRRLFSAIGLYLAFRCLCMCLCRFEFLFDLTITIIFTSFIIGKGVSAPFAFNPWSFSDWSFDKRPGRVLFNKRSSHIYQHCFLFQLPPYKPSGIRRPMTLTTRSCHIIFPFLPYHLLS